jgi:hypothetical protein
VLFQIGRIHAFADLGVGNLLFLTLHLRERMHFRTQFALRLRAAHADATPFMAAIAVPAQQSAKAVDVGAFPGLLIMHVAVDPIAPLLVTYWRSKEDFERCGQALIESVDGTGVVTARHVAEYREPRLPLRKRIKWQVVIGTLLALIGGLDGVRLLYNRVYTQPDVVLSPRVGDINYLTDDTIDEPLAITNRIPVEQHVDVLRAHFQKNGSRLRYPVTVNPSSIRELTENQTEQVRLRTTATEPGAYHLLVQLNVRAGWFASKRKDFALNLVVWAPRPSHSQLRITRRDTTACELQGELLVGTPATNGLTCRIRIARHPEVNRAYVTGLRSTTEEEWQVHGEKNAAVGSALFKIPAIAGYKRSSFHVELESATPTDWNNVLANTEISFDFPTKEAPCPVSQL